MVKWKNGALALGFAAALITSSTAPRAADIEVILALPTNTLTFTSAFIAEDAGFFKKHGLHVTTRQLAGVASNNAVINGTGGVTIVVNGNYAISFGIGAGVNITAPSTGAYAGLAFLGGRSSTPTVTQIFANNTVLNIKGSVYFPNQIVEFDNNGSTTPGGCTQVIGRILRINNNTRLDNTCDGTGVKPLGVSPSRMVE